ncbi:MAG: hypothetical protein HY247_07335 [archaeon]|nr:MAG: hypothetical protein HY247_07335 [archaeon]
MNLRPIHLKKGRGLFHAPAVFLTPETKTDGRILRSVNDRFPSHPGETGLEQIEGFLIYAKDHENVTEGMQLRQESLSGRSLLSKAFLVHPELDFAFRGAEKDRDLYFKTGILDEKIIRALKVAKTEDTPVKRLGKVVRDVYPLIDSKTYANMIRYQLDKDASVVIISGVPITSTTKFADQIEKCGDAIRDSNAILRNVFTGVYGKIDVMNCLTISASVIKPQDYNKLIATAVSMTPDQIGIRLVNMDDSNESQVNNVFNFFSEMYRAMKSSGARNPIHIMNMDHLSYIGWCYGVSAVSLPISTDPYFFGRRSEEAPPKNGVYYNTEDMTYDTFEELHRKMRPTYLLPCYCPICKVFLTIPKAEQAMRWNEFRRMHEVLVRNIELKVIREAPTRIDVALRERLLRSKKLGWTQFIPDKPIIAFAETEL